MLYKVRPGDTLSAIARRFGKSRVDLVQWNNITNANHIRAGEELMIRDPASEAQMADTPKNTPDSVQSQHAADHVDGVLDEMDAVFAEVKKAAADVRTRLRAEGQEMTNNMKLFESHVVGRMSSANSRFRRMIGGNGGPPLEIEHQPDLKKD